MARAASLPYFLMKGLASALQRTCPTNAKGTASLARECLRGVPFCCFQCLAALQEGAATGPESGARLGYNVPGIVLRCCVVCVCVAGFWASRVARVSVCVSSVVFCLCGSLPASQTFSLRFASVAISAREPCRFFQQRRCSWGSRCRFAHAGHDPLKQCPKTAHAFFWLAV